MSPQRKQAAEVFREANEAMMRGDWELTCKGFGKCVELVPENLMFRQALRGATERKYGGNREAAKIPEIVLNEIEAKYQRFRMQRCWLAVVAECQRGLALDPWNTTLNMHLGEALAELGYIDAAAFAFEKALSQDRNNEICLKRLVDLHEALTRYDAAIGYLKRLAGLGDSSLERLDSLIAKRDAAHAAGNVEILGPSNLRRPFLVTREELLLAIEREPTQYRNYVTLAYRERDEGRLDAAAELLLRAYEHSGRQPWIYEQWQDVSLERMQQAASRLREAMLSNSDGLQIKHDYDELQCELRRREIEIYSARLQAYPYSAGTELKLKLAIRYVENRQHKLAIPLLLMARTNPELKLKALLVLGKCFVVTRQVDLALRQFELALTEANRGGDLDAIEELRYLVERLRRKPFDFDPGCLVPVK